MMYFTNGDAAAVNASSKSMLNAGLQRKIRELLNAGATQIVIDLEGLTDIDSVGVGELVIAHISIAQAGGNLTLTHVGYRVKEILRLAGLCDVLTIQEDASVRSVLSEIYIG